MTTYVEEIELNVEEMEEMIAPGVIQNHNVRRTVITYPVSRKKTCSPATIQPIPTARRPTTNM